MKKFLRSYEKILKSWWNKLGTVVKDHRTSNKDFIKSIKSAEN